MIHSEQANIDFSNRHIHYSARLSFIFAGMGMTIWGALIPFIKVNLNINEAALGLLLLCVSLGGFLVIPFTGGIAAKFGCKRTLQMVILLEFAVMVSITFVENILLAILACLLKGISVGIGTVVINIQAVFIEKGCARQLLSHMHAMFSIGNIAGALSMVGLLSLGLSPALAVGLLGFVSCLITWMYCRRYYLPYGSEGGNEGGHGLTLPKGIVIVIGLLCFLVYMNRSVLLDWAALFLVEEHNMPKEQAMLAFALFSATAVIARLMGDKMVQEFGSKKVLIVGSLVAAIGHVIVINANSTWLAFTGFALVGLGVANLIPQLFSFSAKQDVMPTHLAIAAITMLGFLGILVGRVMMGFVAETYTLPVVFGLLSFFLCIIVLVTPFLMKRLK